MIYLIEQKNPSAIIFGALDKSEGRKKLYHSFSNEIANDYNYNYTTNQKDNKQIFILHKNELNIELLMLKVIQISDEIFNI